MSAAVDQHRARDGASRPAEQAEQRRLPLPGRRRRQLAARDRRAQGMEDGQRLSAAGHGFDTSRSSIISPSASVRHHQTLSATFRAPSAVGWMPSRWFRVGTGYSVEQERDERYYASWPDRMI
jgi:hypothetical protein